MGFGVWGLSFFFFWGGGGRSIRVDLSTRALPLGVGFGVPGLGFKVEGLGFRRATLRNLLRLSGPPEYKGRKDQSIIVTLL